MQILIVCRLTDEYLHLLKESKLKSMKTMSGNFAMLLTVIKVTTEKKLIFFSILMIFLFKKKWVTLRTQFNYFTGLF